MLVAVVGLALSPMAASADVGKRDFSFGTSVSAPTGQKPQSKLWWTSGGQWWGVLWSTSSNAWTIHKFDKVARTWSNTGVVVDNRRTAGADALWDGSTLYVTMALKEGSSQTDARMLVHRFSFNAATSTWTSLGAPARVKDGKPEVVVFDKDSTGKLWITYAETNAAGTKSVYVAHTTTDESTWGPAYVLPVAGTTNIKADDISTVVAYGNSTTGRYIGVLYSNQTENTLSFARHRDGGGDTAADWQRIVLASGSRQADGHLNIKGLVDDPSGRVFAVVKTSLNDGSAVASDPLIRLHTVNGLNSTSATVWRVGEGDPTRAILMLDSENKNAHLFATVPLAPSTTSGSIYTKSAKYDSQSFVSGLGTPFIQLASDPKINNTTSAKQTVNSTSGLLVEAGDDTSDFYMHNFLPLSPAADTTPPETTINTGPIATVATNSASFAFSASEPGSSFECRLDGAVNYTPCTSPKDYVALTNGAHTFDVRAKDGAGNVDPTPATRTWTIDTTPPETTITGSPQGTVAVAAASFAFTASELGSSFECRLDGAATYEPCISPKDYSLLADGAHTFDVRAKDSVGNVDATPATRTWTIDTTPPETSLTGGPSGTVATGAASFAFSSTEVGSSFECRLDGAATYAPCTSPKDYSLLADGAHTFDVRAKDSVGNVDPTPATRAWTIDSTPPETTIDTGPSGTVTTTSASFVFGSTEIGSSFECRLDGGEYAPCTSPKDYGSLTEGAHTFHVRAKDAPGNVDPSPATRAWTIDTTPPETTIDNGPSATESSSSASFAFSSSEDGSTFECRLDAGDYAPCTSPKDYYDSLTDGVHTFDVRAKDGAGNVDPSPASRTWTIDTAPPLDTTPPQTTIDSGPSAAEATSSASFAFSSSEDGSTFECRLDAGDYAPCTSPRDYSSLSEGEHTFEVRATDAATNTDPTPASRTWTIDTTSPETTIDSGPSDTETTSSASFAFSSSEDGATFECRLDDGAYAACTSPKDYESLTNGVHTFDVRAKDSAGNVDPSPASRTWTVDATPPSDATPPETTIDDGPPATETTSSASFTFSSSEDGSTFECRLDDGAYAACTSPKDYSSLADGEHTFHVRATDAATNTDPTPASRTWTIDTSPPPDETPPQTTIDSGPDATETTSSASFAFSASEDGSTFECRLDAGDYAPCTSPKDYSSLADGEHTFEVLATDAANNADPSPASLTWTIDSTSPETTVDTGPSGTVATGAASFAFSATGGASSFECRLDGADYAPCTSPKAYSSLTDGAHTFDVRAKDAAGNVDATPAGRTWTIDTTPPQTAIDSGPSGTVATGSASFAFSASEGGSSFECALDGAGYTPCTSPKNYVALLEGAHTFDVRAKDAAGNVDPSPASRTWTVAGATALFSDGFESGNLAAWQVVTGGGGTAVAQTATVKTGTYAAQFTETTTSGSLAYARRAFTTPITDFTITADFNVTQEGASNGNVPLLRLLDSAGARVVMLYRQNATNGTLHVAQNATRVNTTGLLPLATWRTIELRVKIAGTASTVTMKINGQQVYTTTTASLGANGIKNLQLGNDTAAQKGIIAVDNLSVRTGP